MWRCPIPTWLFTRTSKERSDQEPPDGMTRMIKIRNYSESDWHAIERIHDAARKIELKFAGMEEAFLPLSVAAEREGLFAYPGLFVAEQDGQVVGFAACTEDELAWLYVDPPKTRTGIGRTLSEYALNAFPGIRYIEALKGNEPALALYKSLGFKLVDIKKGYMPGNESFAVEVYDLRR